MGPKGHSGGYFSGEERGFCYSSSSIGVLNVYASTDPAHKRAFWRQLRESLPQADADTSFVGRDFDMVEFSKDNSGQTDGGLSDRESGLGQFCFIACTS